MKFDRFNILSGRMEVSLMPKLWQNEETVPDFGFNYFNRIGKLYKPILDQNTKKKPNWPNGKIFAVCLTHDVDSVSRYELKRHLNAIHISLKSLNKSKAQKRLIANLYHLLNNLAHKINPDPFHNFEKWLDLESKFSAHSTFFFFPEQVRKKHITDCCYSYHEDIKFFGKNYSVKEMMQEIDKKGWEIGLHASWKAYNDLDEMKFQKEQIEKIIGHEIKSVRQHKLHTNILLTPSVQNMAGFKFDSSLGFNQNVGFRFGTSYPWHLYNLKEKKRLEILEIPLIITDTALLSSKKGLLLDKNTAFDYCKFCIDEVEKVKGVATLLWHPEYALRTDLFSVYKKILCYADKKNAWFGSASEIGEWWKKENADLNDYTNY